MQNLFNKIIKISIYLLVFLLPLFWLPFTFEAFEFNKQYLLFFLVSLAFFAWIAKMALVDKEIKFKRTPLDIPVLAFLFLAVISTIFSVDRISSLFGFFGRFSDGLIGLLSLGVLYFLITNNTQINIDKNTDKHRLSVSGMLKAFLWSSLFVILFSYLSIFGIWSKFQSFTGLNLPSVMLQRTFNSVSGSLEGLTMFLAVVVVLLVGIVLSKRNSLIPNTLYSILLAAALGLILIIDFKAAWIILGLTMFLFTFIALWKRIFSENINKLLLPIFLIIVAAVFLFINASNFQFSIFNFQLPQEQVLDQRNSWQMAFRAATDNVKNGFLGSGLGTFSYDFSKFKPLEFNQTWLWQIRFDRAGSHIAEILGTTGFLGILSYLFLIGFFLIVSWWFLSSKLKTQSKNSPITDYQLPLLTAFFALLIGQFVYYQNSTLAFIFWLFLGLSVVNWQRDLGELKYSFKDFPEMGLVFSILLIIIVLGFFGTYFSGARFYIADQYYQKAVWIYVGQIPDLNTRIQNLEKSVNLNPWRIEYRIAKARIYLEDALNEMRKPIAEQDSIKIQNRVAEAIDEARIATSISPNRVIAWERRGMIYRDIREMATGATQWGINSFEKAIALEPTNPVLHTELGKLLALDTPEKAKIEFEKAIELKPDYLEAQIQIALMLEQENNLPEAVRKLEDLVNLYPVNIDLLFQLGRLYYNNNQVDEAILKFQQVVDLVPNHSNAHYSLGMAYSAKGEIEKAIKEFERVLELNPGNEDVIQKLEKLKKSK